MVLRRYFLAEVLTGFVAPVERFGPFNAAETLRRDSGLHATPVGFRTPTARRFSRFPERWRSRSARAANPKAGDRLHPHRSTLVQRLRRWLSPLLILAVPRLFPGLPRCCAAETLRRAVVCTLPLPGYGFWQPVESDTSRSAGSLASRCAGGYRCRQSANPRVGNRLHPHRSSWFRLLRAALAILNLAVPRSSPGPPRLYRSRDIAT